MLKTCSKCGKEKSLTSFHFRKDSKKYRNECKKCLKLLQTAHRYNITFKQAARYYEQSHCMCCGVEFAMKPKQKHLHHVDNKMRGVVCKDCNILLRQETTNDLHRLKSCLSFMGKQRENLFYSVNQQGSRRDGKLCGPSTTKRRVPYYSLEGLHVCKTCQKALPVDKFYKVKNTQGILKPITSCKSCYIIYCKSKQYNLTPEQVNFLRSKTNCDCCGSEFQKFEPYIHHVDDCVLGSVCRLCNLFLEQETDQVRHRLISCVKWIEGSDVV